MHFWAIESIVIIKNKKLSLFFFIWKNKRKKVFKFILASSLILGFSVTPELFNVTQAHAQESVKPYYNYSGYTAYQSNFILDKNFKTSLKADNFKINGYKITQNE